MIRRLLLLPASLALLSLSARPASGGTIANFIIVQAIGLSTAGGTFDYPGGTFSGTFSIDESTLPTKLSQFAILPAADVSTTSDAGGLYGPFHYTFGFILLESIVPPGGSSANLLVAEDKYEIELFMPVPGVSPPVYTSQLRLYFIEPGSVFDGGPIFWADENAYRYDRSGDAVALDPAFLTSGTPEPATWALAMTGLTLLVARKTRRPRE
jgi:hypothetical protein